MSSPFDLINLDILEIESQNILTISPPYFDSDSIEFKLKSVYRQMIRSAKLHQRIPTLTYAYYPSMIINTCNIPKILIKQNITPYYRRAAERTYFIFEDNLQQIYYIKFTTLFLIKQLKTVEYQTLC
ncbi:4810_t:CDS:1 [Funneliformis geosporum]|nr:4810_t:CDS:1 [Funneliformis geosporum]